MRRIAAALILATAATALARDPSPVIFPEQRVPLIFSHKQHLALHLQCDFCHEAAPSSTSVKEHLIPKEALCATCHKGIDRAQPDKQLKPGEPEVRCAACHAGPDPSHPQPVSIPTANIKFNHKVHDDAVIPCETCHGDVKQKTLATRADLPRMPLCLRCHNSTAETNRAPSKCSTCHLTRADGTMEVQFASGVLTPSGTLKGDAHTPQFAVEHKQVAAQEGAYCESCHRKEFCQSCHNGVIKPMAFHGNDYVTIHAVDARKATTDCNGCHRRQTFCLGCHERSGVVDTLTNDGKSGITQVGKRFHPPYQVWVSTPRTPEHHSWQAVRNLRACVSCHREDTCLQCHSAVVDGQHTFNVSPHPAGFAGSRMCNALASHNARVCLKCHNTNDAHITCK